MRALFRCYKGSAFEGAFSCLPPAIRGRYRVKMGLTQWFRKLKDSYRL